MDEPLLTPQETGDLVRLSPRTLERRRRTGDSPPWVALGPRCIRYRRSDLLAWVENHLQNMPSDAQPAEAT